MNSEALFAITANVGGKVRSYNLKIKDRAGKTDEEIIEILKRDSGLISIHKLWTVETSSALPEEEKLRMLKEAKPGTWYDGWVPYCGAPPANKCSMPRMTKMPYGTN